MAAVVKTGTLTERAVVTTDTVTDDRVAVILQTQPKHQFGRSEPPGSDRYVLRGFNKAEPTVCRRLERLREYDLVTEDIQPVTDGKNSKLYRTELDGVEQNIK